MATIKPLDALTDEFLPKVFPGQAMWIYRCKGAGGFQTGLWVATDPVDIAAGRIIPHEAVLPKKLDQLVAYMERNTITRSPVLLTYLPSKQIDELITDICLHELPYVINRSNQEHHLWCISDPTIIAELQQYFLAIEEVYVADGHHRLAATKTLARSISSLYVSTDELEILPFHRIIKLDTLYTSKNAGHKNNLEPVLSDFNASTFLEELSVHFKINVVASNVPFRPVKRQQIGMFFLGKWYQLDVIQQVEEHTSRPDVRLLQDLILAPLLGIENPDSDSRLVNYPDIYWDDFAQALDSNPMHIGFTLYPMMVGELLDAAKHGALLPPKSTWITPKIPDRLLMDSGTANSISPSSLQLKNPV